MSKAYVLYNPLAGKGKNTEKVKKLYNILTDEIILCDITKEETYENVLPEMQSDDYIVVCGGDGTLNRFVNRMDEINCEVYFYPLGSGNDFARDIGMDKAEKPFPITEYIKNLPTVIVNGADTYRFINGVGYGIDGYCCMVGNEKRKKNKKVNYLLIALKGFISGYKPADAKVTIDGKVFEYKKLWLAPTMIGRFFGGGMKITPNQDRKSGLLSTMLFHDAGKLYALWRFPTIFPGKHIKYKRKIKVFTGKSISVEFSNPSALQIDGETILNVKSYSASIGAACAIQGEEK